MPDESPQARAAWVRERALAIGFDLCGIAPVEGLDELRNLPEWLAHDYAGEMKYLHDPRRADPRLVLEGARSMIVVALNYNSSRPYSTASSPNDSGGEPPKGWISRYAWGDDYHVFLRDKLEILLGEMRGAFTVPFSARAYVDTGPIVERVAAKYAGIGWLAKNTCLINQQLGSWLFLGVIVTTLHLEPSLPPGHAPAPDLCGSCTRCLDACPTQAFPQPYILDSRRCISYLTIELRDAIPEALRPKMGGAVIGCDICQDVCPWNRKAPVTSLAAFQSRDAVASPSAKFTPAPAQDHETSDSGSRLSSAMEDRLRSEPSEAPQSLFSPDLLWLASLSQQEFSNVFRGSPVKRAKWRGLVRNTCIALGNSRISCAAPAYPRVLRLLERLAASEDPIIAEHARWALARVPSPSADSSSADRLD